MKKIILLIITALFISVSTNYAQNTTSAETFFSQHKDVVFEYESGAMDIGAKGTVKVGEISGYLISLEVTYYSMGPDYFKKQNPKTIKNQIEFKDGLYKWWMGDYLNKGKVYNGKLMLRGSNGDYIKISLPKDVIASEKDDIKLNNVKLAVEKRSNNNLLYTKIQNVWKNTFINIEHGITCSQIAPGWHSAMWILEPSEDGHVKIKNRWKGTYLNVESGSLRCSEIQPGWHSAMWMIEPIEGTNEVRIKNRWKGTYLNVESGKLNCTDIQPGWASAKWKNIKAK